jgi:iron(III) transport system substrate-binding protein
MRDSDESRLLPTRTRRDLLAGASVATLAATSGCISNVLDGGNDNSKESDPGLIGSSRMGRDPPGGTSMKDMPDLSGTLTLYSGRHEWLVGELVEYIENLYDDFNIDTRYESSTALANQIETAGDATDADVFYSVNAGALGQLADAGRTKNLSSDVLDKVPSEYHAGDGSWTGISGRARTIPYNTDEFSESDIPDKVAKFPEQAKFEGEMGWAPSYGSFQAFVTAMRVLEGRKETKEWLQGMLDSGVKRYADEFRVSQAVADGEIYAGFANHYYIQRVLAADSDASIATAFTSRDAGAIFNVAGGAVVEGTDDAELADDFVQHLLSAEAQEYFAIKTFEYPLVPEVEPVGELPTIDELKPPKDFDLTELSDLEPTIKLMRNVGIKV